MLTAMVNPQPNMASNLCLPSKCSTQRDSPCLKKQAAHRPSQMRQLPLPKTTNDQSINHISTKYSFSFSYRQVLPESTKQYFNLKLQDLKFDIQTQFKDILKMTNNQVTAKTLQELLDFAAKHKAIAVDFYADWCGPCKRIAPYLHTKCVELGVALAKVNVDVNSEAAEKYGVKAMPTFHVLNSKGESVFNKVGGSQAVVNEVITHAKNLK